MSWQEELRKLDEELAAGRISADEYRVRRDKVLASAVSSGSQGEPQGPGVGESTQFMSPAPPGEPAPPQPGGPDQADQQDNADKTQIVPGQAGEQTQAVGWHTARPSGNDAERTQVVPGVPPQNVAGGQIPRPAPGQYPQDAQYGPPPGWQQPQEEPGLPWAGQDLPPLSPTGTPDWVRQGPELFESEDRSKTGKILLIVLAVVLVAGIGVGALFFFARDKDGNQPQAGPTSESQQSSSTAPPKPKDDLSTAELPGEAEDHSNINTFADAEASKFLTPEEIAIYKEAGAAKSRLVASTTEDGVHTLIFTTQAGSAEKAATASAALAQQQITYGMTEYGTAPQNVKAAQFPKSDTIPATIRAHYSHKGTIIRVQVNGDDLAKVTQVFDDLIAAQLEVLEANG